MVLSFVFLAEFGRASVVALRGQGPGRWILLALLGLAGLGGLLAGLPGFSAGSRYALGLVGGLWAAGALYLASKVPVPGSRALQGAALGMAGYALAAGLVVSPAPFFPASPAQRGLFHDSRRLAHPVGARIAGRVDQRLPLVPGRCFPGWGGGPSHPGLGTQPGEGAAAGVFILLVCGWLLTQRLGNEALQVERSNQEHEGEVLQVMMLDKMAGADHLVAVMSGSPWVVPPWQPGNPGGFKRPTRSWTATAGRCPNPSAISWTSRA